MMRRALPPVLATVVLAALTGGAARAWLVHDPVLPWSATVHARVADVRLGPAGTGAVAWVDVTLDADEPASAITSVSVRGHGLTGSDDPAVVHPSAVPGARDGVPLTRHFRLELPLTCTGADAADSSVPTLTLTVVRESGPPATVTSSPQSWEGPVGLCRLGLGVQPTGWTDPVRVDRFVADPDRPGSGALLQLSGLPRGPLVVSVLEQAGVMAVPSGPQPGDGTVTLLLSAAACDRPDISRTVGLPLLVGPSRDRSTVRYLPVGLRLARWIVTYQASHCS